MKFLIYDIETLSNAFVCCLYNVEKDIRKHFVVYGNENCVGFVKWMKNNTSDYYHVGYNNLGFDGQIIAAIVKNPFMVAADIYREAQRIIELKDDLGDKVQKKLLFESELPFKQIDIYKIKHYDSNAKRTSLKWLEFSFRQMDVMEMPIHHSENISREQLETIIEYCWNDVDTTLKAFNFFKDDIQSRFDLSNEFGIGLHNSSEPKVVKKVYLSELSKKLDVPKAELEQRCEEYRSSVKPFKPRIIDWIDFGEPMFEGVKKKFSQLVIDPHNVKGSVKLSYFWKNIKIEHGLGGLHACVKPGVYTNKDLMILDIDFTSYYPFLKIRNGIYPPYYGPEYLEIYEGFFHKRKLYPKGHPLNGGYKLMLNGSFGLLKEINSPIYYPEGFVFVTVNGQLILLYMLEQIAKAAPEVFILQCNTDGITIMFDRNNLDRITDVLSNIEKLSGIQVETVEYERMIIRDVNNYIAVDINGKAKHKGAFELKKEMHKNNSFAIIPKAIDAYFVKGIKDYRSFIKQHTDIFDFLGAVKKKSNFNLDFYFVDDGKVTTEEQQRITRYFVSNKGGSLIKDFDAKEGNKNGKVRMESGWNITIANKLESFKAKDFDINYAYYISETGKAIEEIEGIHNQTLLFK